MEVNSVLQGNLVSDVFQLTNRPPLETARLIGEGQNLRPTPNTNRQIANLQEFAQGIDPNRNDGGVVFNRNAQLISADPSPPGSRLNLSA